MHVRQLLVGFEPVRLAPDARVIDAVRAMVARNCGSVLVEGADGAMAGIFTERDLMTRVIAAGRPVDGTPLSEVMTVDVYRATPDDDVTQVRRELRARHIRHVPVLDGGRVVAVLSVRDLLQADFVAQRESAAAMDAYIRGHLQ